MKTQKAKKKPLRAIPLLAVKIPAQKDKEITDAVLRAIIAELKSAPNSSSKKSKSTVLTSSKATELIRKKILEYRMSRRATKTNSSAKKTSKK